MYVKLECPSGGCGAWDVFANVKAEDPVTGNWIELGRFITPYGVDNHQRVDGFEFDVTDFRSILNGQVKLKVFVEVWTKEGWLLTVDFKVVEGDQDYPYSSVISLIDYSEHSQQIPYGIALDDPVKLSGQVEVPANSLKAKIRTIVSGWGHATPNDSGGRGCAEWCFRTHVLHFGNKVFSHELAPLGCDTNPVQPQYGNWAPSRAGWCPGMEVPIRINQIPQPEPGKSLDFEYAFENWDNDLGNGQAYYSVSSYLIVESTTEFSEI